MLKPLKILICSPLFSPSVGGLENVMRLLAEDLCALGCEVRVMTTTDGNNELGAFQIIRHPSPSAFLELTRWCDIFLQACVSLKHLWPLAVIRRPYAVIYHTWYQKINGSRSMRDRLKKLACRFATNVSVSRAIAYSLGVPSTVIANPYDPMVFFSDAATKTTRDLICVARLVSDKGIDTLLNALVDLKTCGLSPSLTIVGHGPEKDSLRALGRHLGVSGQVEWHDNVVGEALANLYRLHRIVVIPSRWNEPFGLVALEGIACGCVAVGSQGGGLPEAIGPCGVTFPNGSVEGLSATLKLLLQTPETWSRFRSAAPAHLKQFERHSVAQHYLRIFQDINEERMTHYES